MDTMEKAVRFLVWREFDRRAVRVPESEKEQFVLQKMENDRLALSELIIEEGYNELFLRYFIAHHYNTPKFSRDAFHRVREDIYETVIDLYFHNLDFVRNVVFPEMLRGNVDHPAVQEVIANIKGKFPAHPRYHARRRRRDARNA